VTRPPRPLPGPARIAVDLLGGEDAPAVVVDGALRASSVDPELRLLLVGPREVADEVVSALPPAARDRVDLLLAAHAVGATDEPVRAVRPGTTVLAGASAVSRGAADGLVSAGPSGATVTAAVLALGRGVRRPPLAAMLPGRAGPVVLLDVGGSVDPAPPVLLANALLGSAYARVVLGVDAPRIGLLSIGAEPGKGDRWRRAAYGRLGLHPLPEGARFVGNVEGYDVSLGDRADVVVTDGFTGNVLLKGIEGAYALAGGEMPPETAPRAAALLGVGGTVVVCHSAAGGQDLASAIMLAAFLHRVGAAAQLKTAVGHVRAVSAQIGAVLRSEVMS